jgi:hypothetical protein
MEHAEDAEAGGGQGGLREGATEDGHVVLDPGNAGGVERKVRAEHLMATLTQEAEDEASAAADIEDEAGTGVANRGFEKADMIPGDETAVEVFERRDLVTGIRVPVVGGVVGGEFLGRGFGEEAEKTAAGALDDEEGFFSCGVETVRGMKESVGIGRAAGKASIGGSGGRGGRHDSGEVAA